MFTNICGTKYNWLHFNDIINFFFLIDNMLICKIFYILTNIYSIINPIKYWYSHHYGGNVQLKMRSRSCARKPQPLLLRRNLTYNEYAKTEHAFLPKGKTPYSSYFLLNCVAFIIIPYSDFSLLKSL